MNTKWTRNLCSFIIILMLISISLTALLEWEIASDGAGGSLISPITGSNDNDRFGWNVSSAGDVNGDGHSDIIVGAPGYDNNRGRAYIFFGGSWLSGSLLADNANVTINGSSQGDQFGWDVAGAGDVNSDGFDDVMVGAPGNNSDSGAVYIFYGNGLLPSIINAINANITFFHERTGDRFGSSVSGAGDVNKDSYDDVIVGAPYHDNWWNDSWSYRKKLAFDNSGQSEDLINFPVLINLSAANFNYSKAKTDGTDLRFIDSDGFTQLNYHIEEWNTSGNSFVWVNVTHIPEASSNDYICMYYGNPLAPDIQDIPGTYDANYVGVWHLNETVTDEQTTGMHYDSTSNNNDGSQNGSDDISGKISNGQYFDGIDDSIDCGNKSNLNVNYITIEFWLRVNSWVSDGGIFAKGDNSYRQYWIWTYGNEVSFEIDEAPYQNYAWSPSLGQWEHLVLTYNGTNVTTYRNGLQENIYPQVTGTIDPTSEPLLFGYIPSYYYFNGSIDEVRISNISRSPDWIKAQYLSMNGSFITFGLEETKGKNVGAAYIFYGNGSLNPLYYTKDADGTLNGSYADELFGFSVSNIGDVNNDGYDDVIVGAPGSDRVYIYYGNDPMSNQADLILNGISNESFGFSVSGAGDVNNNGYNDIIIGAPYARNWWNDSWLYRRKLTFNNSGQSETLLNFPVMINLSALNFNYSRARAGGLDLRFIDSDCVTELKYHIEEWNSSGASYIWVNVTSIDMNSDTDHIWMYYGNPTASNVQDPARTYDNSFISIWHLEEDPGPGGVGDIIDTTLNNNNGTAEPSMTSGDLISGRIGYGIDFDGNNDYIDCGTGASLNISSAITVEAWAKTDTDNGGTIASKHGTSDYGWVVHRVSGTDSLRVIWSIDGTNYVYPQTAANTFEINTWYHLVITFDGSIIRAYIDGMEDTSGDFPYSYGGLHVSATSTQIARDGYMGTDPAYMFNGILDEVRISNAARSADWIEAQYLSMDNRFVIYGNEEINTSYVGKAYIFDGSYISVEAVGDRYINISDGDIANYTFTGESSNGLFGYSVSSARHFTNSLFSDVIVGAPNAGGNGAVYVFCSGISLASDIFAQSADIIELGENSSDYFGWSVSNSGDAIQADGYDEILIGAPFHDPILNNNAGRAYILIAKSRPLIKDVFAIPNVQEIGGYVNLTCNVTNDIGVNEVRVNITLPGGGFDNISMDLDSGDQWFYNNTYAILGIYQYTIWVCDPLGNWSFSSGHGFTIQDITLPLIINVLDIPDPQEMGGSINISCEVTDNVMVDGVWVNITLPGGGYNNVSMNQWALNQWFLNNTYTTLGLYQYTIWVNDTNNNWNSSSGHVFTIQDKILPEILNVLEGPDPQQTGGYINITCDVIDNDVVDTVWVNITLPGGGYSNISMIKNIGAQWFLNNTYATEGIYQYTIWSTDGVGNWNSSSGHSFVLLASRPQLSNPVVTPTSGNMDTGFNFTVNYLHLFDKAPDGITLNLTGPSGGIYNLIETDPSDNDYTDGKSYYLNLSGLSVGSYSFHFATRDSDGLWGQETPEVSSPEVVLKTGQLTASDCVEEYGDVIVLQALLIDSNSLPLSGERISFYIDLNQNGIYETGEYAGSSSTQVNGNVSVTYLNHISCEIYNFTAIYNDSGYIVQDDEAILTVIAEQATLTALSAFVEQGELISLAATLIDDDDDPVSGEDVAFYVDRNKNGIYEASEFIGSDTTSASGIASISYTVNLVPDNYGLWAKYEGSANYMVDEIEGQLTVKNTVNNPPTILGNVPDQIKLEDSLPWSLDLTSYEGDFEDSGPDLKWYLTGVNNTLYSVTGMNSTNDVLTFILLENAFGNDEVTLWLVDSDGASVSQVLWVNITPVNDLPYFDPKPPDLFVHYDDPSIDEDDPTPWNYRFYVHDIETPIEGLIITTSEPEVDLGDGYVEVDGLNVTYHYPQTRINESILVTLTLSDGTDIAQTVILLNITSDWVPELTRKLPDIILEENTTAYNVFDLDDYFTDRDNDSLYYSSGYFHIEVNINENHTVDITSFGEWTGSELVTFRAKDPIGAIVEDTITVTIIPVNDEPVISGVPDLFVHFDYSYAFDLSPYITDADNLPSELRITTSESLDNIWMKQDDNMCMVINYPESMNDTTILVTIYVSDGIDTASQQIHITITDNFPPELIYKLPDISFYEDSVLMNAFVLSNYFLDIDGDVLYYTNGTKSISVVINSNLTVDFSAPENWHGFEFVTFRATDPTGALAEDKILVVVIPVNDAPTIGSIPRQEKDEGEQWILDLSQYIDDVDNDISELTITIESEVGRDYVTLVGTILIFQYPNDVKTDIITITVSDGEHETQRSFSVNIKGSAKVAPAIWDAFPWPWILLALFAVIGGVIAFYLKRNKYQVYEVFLIHKTGLFIAHKTVGSTDMVEDVKQSGMFMAGMTLIRDSFEDDDEITISDKLSVMGKELIAGRGEEVFILIVHTGDVKKRTLEEIKNVIERIEERYRDILVDWDGDTELLVGIEDYFGSLF